MVRIKVEELHQFSTYEIPIALVVVNLLRTLLALKAIKHGDFDTDIIEDFIAEKGLKSAHRGL